MAPQEFTAAHEFGHLLGGDHYDAPHLGLLDNSRAWHEFVPPVFNSPAKELVSAIFNKSNSSVCGAPGTGALCARLRTYSDSDFGDADHRNADALGLTARSVANYVGGNGDADDSGPAQCQDGIDNDGDSLVDLQDADCASTGDDNEAGPPPSPNPPGCNATVAPVNVTGELRAICDPQRPNYTLYEVSWQHACPQAVSSYEAWFSQPDGAPYQLGWDGITRSVFISVIGSNSRIRVRACGTSVCSPFSSSSFVAVDQC